MGSQLPLKGAQPRQFSIHVYYGQTAGWMKTPLGTEVDLGTGHIVLDGDPALRERDIAAPSPLFGPCLLWPRSPISATDELLFMNHSVHAKMLKLLGTSTGAPPLDPTGDFHPPDHLSRASQKSCIRPWKNSILSFVTKRH